MGGIQEMLGILRNFDTNVDIIFVIDATDRTQPLTDKIKQMAIYDPCKLSSNRIID